MGENITNDNIDEFLTSYIDGQISDPDTDKQIKNFIDRNELVSKKYKTELLTKKLFRSRLASVELPNATLLKVNNSIDSLIQQTAESRYAEESRYATESRYAAEDNIYSAGFLEYLKRLLAAPVNIGRTAVPRYAFALTLIVILVAAGMLMNKKDTNLNPFIATGSEKSVMVQAMKNFHKILSGDIEPEIKTNDANRVKSFVKDKSNFDAYVPAISDYELVGAVCNEYNGQKLVHLLYSSGGEVIYIYETQVNSLHCKELELPEPVHHDIMKDKYYMCDKVDENECTMIVWYKDNVVCASVSTMPKQRMYSSFTSFR